MQPVSQLDYSASANIQEGARLDVAMNGFWGGRSERSFVDLRVFNPLAVSNASSSLSSNFHKHENIKKRVTSHICFKQLKNRLSIFQHARNLCFSTVIYLCKLPHTYFTITISSLYYIHFLLES